MKLLTMAQLFGLDILTPSESPGEWLFVVTVPANFLEGIPQSESPRLWDVVYRIDLIVLFQGFDGQPECYLQGGSHDIELFQDAGLHLAL
jgi:hypothetical protein